MAKEIHTTFQQIIQTLNVNITFFGIDYSKIHTIDHSLREHLSSNGSYQKFIDIFQKKATSDHIIKIKDSFHLYYYFYAAPDFSKEEKKYFCIGPILTGEMTEEKLLEILNSHHMSKTLISDFYTYYNQVSIIENLATFEKTLNINYIDKYFV